MLLVRYVLEDMDEQRVLAVDAQGDVANCSLTSFRRERGTLRLEAYNAVGHLEQDDAADVTAEPDRPRAAR